MSSIAIRPSERPTTFAGRSPRTIRQKMQSSSGSEDPLLGDRLAPYADELADLAPHDPRRVVAREAAARPIDEHDVLAPDLLAPPCKTRFARMRAQPRAALPLDAGGHPVLRRRGGSRPWGVREDVNLRDARTLDRRQRRLEGALVLTGEADDHVRREVEPGSRLEAPQIGGHAVAPPHRPQHAVVTGLQRH